MGGLKRLFLVLLLSLGCSPDNGEYLKTKTEETFEYVSRATSRVVDLSREASVKVAVHSLNGDKTEGSGAYLKYKGHHLVLTAAHVVEGNHTALIIAGKERVIADVVYYDEYNDIAILRLEGLFTRKPLTWRLSDVTIGEKVVYTGFPNGYDALSIQGVTSGFSGSKIVLHSYAWYGSSGSAVLDEKGRIVGGVSAIDIGYAFFELPQIVEDIVIVAPIRSVREDVLLDALSS